MAGRLGRAVFKLLGQTVQHRPVGMPTKGVRFLCSSPKKTRRELEEEKYVNNADFKNRSFSSFYASVYGEEVPKGEDGLPLFVDWSLIPGALAGVPDQGFSGTCFIFGPVGSITSANFILTGETVELSAQHVLDCHTATGAGDDGGQPVDVMEFVLKAGGILPESAYPFTGYRGICREVKAKGVTIDGYKLVKPFDEYALKCAVSFQPVVVSIRVSVPGLRFGKHTGNKILDGPSSWKLDHTVLLTGYDKNLMGKLYWSLVNSYSEYWGDNGFFYIARGTGQKAGALGILREPLVPLKYNVNDNIVVSTCNSCPRCWPPKMPQCPSSQTGGISSA